MNNRLETYQKKFNKLQNTEELYKTDLSTAEKNLKRANKRLHNLEKARIFLQKVAQDTQSNLEDNINSIVSQALDAVFEKPYEFKMEFVKRRNKTECDLFFMRNGKKRDPLSSSGYGAVDVASFANRASCWALNKTTRGFLLLDEPFKNLSADLQAACSEMLTMISRELNIQLLIVSHLETMIDEADKIFEVKLKDGISTLKELA